MGSFVSRLLYGTLEAIVAGVAIGGILALVRRVQIAFGVTEEKENRRVHVSSAS